MRTYWQIWLISAAWRQLELCPPHLNMPTWSPPLPISPCGKQGACTDHRIKHMAVWCLCSMKINIFIDLSTSNGLDATCGLILSHFLSLCRAGLIFFYQKDERAVDANSREVLYDLQYRMTFAVHHFKEDHTTTPSLE